MDDRHSDGRFKLGKKGGPGRKPGGKSQALALVDKICGKAKNLKLLEKKLQAEFDRDPILFFKTIIIPLSPKPAPEPVEPDEVGFATMTAAESARAMDAATISSTSTVGDDIE